MKYKELIQFEPIVDIIQLREGNTKENAKQHVNTYVVSEHMKNQFIYEIIPNLNMDNPTPNQKGLLIIGNYGTGKSHLMSIIGAIAEYDDMVDVINDLDVKGSVKPISGKYKVIRTEIGDTPLSLRNIIVKILEKNLKNLGISYIFPPQEEIINHKDCFEEMMGRFEEKYTVKGLLLIVDELLDYLRGRTEQEIVHDFSFLREIGEICANTNFKFIAGLQKALFGNPRFNFVSASLNRIKDRFKEIKISHEDVEYVVSNRLLKKSIEQKNKIKGHLVQFKKLYPILNKQYEQFVDLFPVHPSYIEVFQEMTIIEKREILKTLSEVMTDLMDHEITSSLPGLITFDKYYDNLKRFISNEDVNKIIKVSDRLTSLIELNMEKKKYINNSKRIIQGLSVYRLAVISINTNLGLTIDKIRDNLFIFETLPQQDHKFLSLHIKAILEEIKVTVTGQFIGFNTENQQYYLDLEKIVDYEQKIQDKIPLIPEKYDEYYYEIMKILMEQQMEPYVTGFRIWQYEIIWKDHNVGRNGYLFFGVPNERSTAQPPRDFYIYFMKIFRKNSFTDELKDDELFIKFNNLPDEILQLLKHFAAANDLIYSEDKDTAKKYQIIKEKDEKKIINWFRENIIQYMTIIYKGNEEPITSYFSLSSESNFKNIVDILASKKFGSYFDKKYNDYPVFKKVVTTKNIYKICEATVKFIAGGVKVENARNLLKGLELLKGDLLSIDNSRYTKWIIQELKKKSGNNVLRRNELIFNSSGVEISKKYELEIELVAVLLAALIWNGNAIISIKGLKIDASNIDKLKVRFNDLINFNHLEKPHGIDWPLLKKIFAALGITPGLATEMKISDGIKELLTTTKKLSSEIVEIKNNLLSLPQSIFGIKVFSDAEMKNYISILESGLRIIDKLSIFDKRAKLMKLDIKDDEIVNIEKSLSTLDTLKRMRSVFEKMRPFGDYLLQSENYLHKESLLITEIQNLKIEFKKHITNINSRLDDSTNSDFYRQMNSLKNDIISEYIKYHQKARMNKKQDDIKKGIIKNDKMIKLNKLKGIELMPSSDLDNLYDKLNNLKPCFSVTKTDLEITLACPHCKFDPNRESFDKAVDLIIDDIKDEIEQIYNNWIEAITRNLEDPLTKPSIELLEKKEERDEVSNFLKRKDFPDKGDKLNDFINGVNKASAGLEKVILKADNTIKALKLGGFPCTVEELIERFSEFIIKKTNKNEKSRIILE